MREICSIYRGGLIAAFVKACSNMKDQLSLSQRYIVFWGKAKSDAKASRCPVDIFPSIACAVWTLSAIEISCKGIWIITSTLHLVPIIWESYSLNPIRRKRPFSMWHVYFQGIFLKQCSILYFKLNNPSQFPNLLLALLCRALFLALVFLTLKI